jgi:RNA polymerase sigma factor (sigma-70 family)
MLAELDEPLTNTTPAAELAWRKVVIATLRGLPPRDAELVRLRYVEDLQYSVIAERLDLPLGTVKIRLHRLHKRLRKVATDEGIPGDI